MCACVWPVCVCVCVCVCVWVSVCVFVQYFPGACQCVHGSYNVTASVGIRHVRCAFVCVRARDRATRLCVCVCVCVFVSCPWPLQRLSFESNTPSAVCPLNGALLFWNAQRTTPLPTIGLVQFGDVICHWLRNFTESLPSTPDVAICESVERQTVGRSLKCAVLTRSRGWSVEQVHHGDFRFVTVKFSPVGNSVTRMRDDLLWLVWHTGQWVSMRCNLITHSAHSQERWDLNRLRALPPSVVPSALSDWRVEVLELAKGGKVDPSLLSRLVTHNIHTFEVVAGNSSASKWKEMSRLNSGLLLFAVLCYCGCCFVLLTCLFFKSGDQQLIICILTTEQGECWCFGHSSATTTVKLINIISVPACMPLSGQSSLLRFKHTGIHGTMYYYYVRLACCFMTADIYLMSNLVHLRSYFY